MQRAKPTTILDGYFEHLRRVVATDEVERDRIARGRDHYRDEYVAEQQAQRNATTLASLRDTAANATKAVVHAHGKLSAQRDAIAKADAASWDFARLQVQREEIGARLDAAVGGGVFGGQDRVDRYMAVLDDAMKSGDRHAMRAAAGAVESRLADLGVVKAGPLAEKIQAVGDALVPAELVQIEAEIDQLRDDAQAYLAEVYAIEGQVDPGPWKGGRAGGIFGREASPVAKAVGDTPPPNSIPGAEPFEPSPVQSILGVRS